MHKYIESLLLAAFMLAVLTPLRFIVLYVFSDHWLGTVGLISAAIISITILSRKNKLGLIGRIYNRKLKELRHSRKIFFTIPVFMFFIYIAVATIAGLNHNVDQSLEELQAEIQAELATIPKEALLEHVSEELTLVVFLLAFVTVFFLPIFNFDLWALFIQSLDVYYEGWLAHFVVIMLVEICESLGIILYFRLRHNNK